MIEANFILWPGDPPGRTSMGGKAAALAELAQAGFPVPDWFAIAPAARQLDDRALAEHLAAPLARLAPATRFAVRSSGVCEDGSEHSFAGQFESYLDVPVDEVVARVRDVWSSAGSDRVRAYTAERGIDLRDAVPAVIVQCMVAAEAAGVAFSADPVSGGRAYAVVSAVAGLGDRLVSGDVDADTYHVDRTGAIVKRSAAGSSPACDDRTVIAIADLARRCARHFGRPQDIEWAAAEGKLYLLQSRPITTLSGLADPDGTVTLWDNSNIVESYSGVTTPLTFSFARHAYAGVYREFCKLMRVPRSVVAANDEIFDRMLGLIRGRVYYNLINWYRLIAMLPGFASNRGFMEQMMGVGERLPDAIADQIAARSRTSPLRDRLNLVRTAGGMVANHLTLDRSIRRFTERLEVAMRPPVPPLADQRLDELAQQYLALESQLLTRWDAPIVNDFFAMIFFGVLRKLCASWLQAPGLENEFVGNEGGIISVEPARRIRAMAEAIKAEPPLVDLLCDGPISDAHRAAQSHPQLGPLYRAYLEKFADRCLEELKLESMTLADDPAPLLRAVGQTARRPERGQADTGDSRENAERTAAVALQEKPFRRKLFDFVLRNARARVRDRENLRFERTRVFGRVRRIFLEMGQRLFAEGRLDDPRDVFYLEVHELMGIVDGTVSCDDVRGLATTRRNTFDRYRAEPAPSDRFTTRGAVWIGNSFVEPTRASDQGGPDDAVLRGLPCCAGVVRGVVQVVRDPRGAELPAGSILVAERTDPGWIMLFPAAAGLLVERGSLLSHSAIVAREMQIPAIVSIAGLTTRLASGDVVEMDGTAGTVRILSRGTPS